MATTQIKSANSENQAIVDDTGHLLVTGTIAASNPSVGTTGTPAPASATEIAGIDSSGNLHPVSVDANGFVNVNGVSTVVGPVTTEQAGLNSFQTSQYAIGTSAIQLAPTPLANRSSISITIEASPNIAVFVGNSSAVTISTGYPLYDGSTLQLDLTPSGSVWAISSVTGQTAAILEIA